MQRNFAVWELMLRFCAYKFDGHYFLILSFKDDAKYRLTNLTTVKIKLNDGSVLKLEGYEGSRKTSSSSVYWGTGFSTSSANERHYAIVEISQEQMEKLKVGVDKVAINTIPEVYKLHKWNGKAKFGSTLYEDFVSLKDDFDE
ncbi:MAG: hypothetical protein IJ588_07070 [Prevotella sp.]|nr:hypothetical protein [Prevotella sp.]